MESNREDSERCLEIAKRALVEGDTAKAVKFAEKAQRLFPTASAEQILSLARSVNPCLFLNHNAFVMSYFGMDIYFSYVVLILFNRSLMNSGYGGRFGFLA